jgi:hypothetical protein
MKYCRLLAPFSDRHRGKEVLLATSTLESLSDFKWLAEMTRDRELVAMLQEVVAGEGAMGGENMARF